MICACALGAKSAACLSRKRFCEKKMAVLVYGDSVVAVLLLEKELPTFLVNHVYFVLIWKTVLDRQHREDFIPTQDVNL